MDEIESMAVELVTEFAAGLTEPGSMRAVVAHGCRRSQTYNAAGNRALIERMRSRDLFAGIERIRSAHGTGGAFVFEMSVTASGEYAVAWSGDLSSLPPRVVFDDSYRYPNHPHAGMAKPSAALNDGRPTDPVVLAHVRGLIAEFVERHTQLLGVPPKFVPGYSEAEILEIEQRLGVRLPEDVRALYGTIHDDRGESGLLGRYSPAPLEQVVAWYGQGEPGVTAVGREDLFDDDPVVFETHPHGHVRRLSRSDWWVTFAPDYGMNYAALDLDPAGSGSYGQVLMFGRDVWGPIGYVAPSVTHLMESVLDFMREAEPNLDGWGDEEWPADVWNAPGYAWSVDVGDRALADHVGAHPDASAIQAAHLRQVDRVSLADLAGFSNLRAIRVLDVRQKAVHVDLSIPTGLPVEQVHIVAGGFEPYRLATTPSITYLTLAGNTDPVSIAALASLPNLLRLDLSEAIVSDIAAIAAFAALRVLILNPQQWDELTGSGRVPDQLAAAALGEGAGVATSAGWATAVRGAGHQAIPYRTIRGVL